STFDNDGQQTIDFGASDNYCLGAAVDSADRVLVAGYAFNGYGSNTDFAVARLTSAGALDSTFDGDGEQTTGLVALSKAQGHSTAIDSLGRVLVAGYASNGSNDDFAVARYTAAGILDTSFAGTGTVVFGFGASVDLGFAVAV